MHLHFLLFGFGRVVAFVPVLSCAIFIAQHCCHFYELMELETEVGYFFPKWRINGIGPNSYASEKTCANHDTRRFLKMKPFF